MNLLIVNDEVIAAKGIMNGIPWNEYGINGVEAVFDAESAKTMLEQQSFDILLCDIEMPGENGIELVRWLRKRKIETEVIFLTCHADFDFAQEAIKLKCRNYILVPAAYEDIAAQVYEVVLAIEKHREDLKHQQYGQFWIAEKERDQELKHSANIPEKSVESVKEYIKKHLNDSQLSLNQIAAWMFMNSDYLNRVFKRETGETIGHYILERRMELAASLLKERIGATQVAELVGYNSYTSFVAAFKNFYGCPPSKYLDK